MQNRLITVAQYARSRKARGLAGGTRQAVEKAIASGRISVIDGLIDPEVADIQWDKNTRKRADIHGESETIEAPEYAKEVSWGEAKARTERAVAELKELELAKRKGELIDRASYERAARQTARILRDALVTTLPSKIALELAVLTDPWQVECRLRDSIRGELHAVCGALTTEAEAEADALSHDDE
jgi:hypothetical protein